MDVQGHQPERRTGPWRRRRGLDRLGQSGAAMDAHRRRDADPSGLPQNSTRSAARFGDRSHFGLASQRRQFPHRHAAFGQHQRRDRAGRTAAEFHRPHHRRCRLDCRAGYRRRPHFDRARRVQAELGCREPHPVGAVPNPVRRQPHHAARPNRSAAGSERHVAVQDRRRHGRAQPVRRIERAAGFQPHRRQRPLRCSQAALRDRRGRCRQYQRRRRHVRQCGFFRRQRPRGRRSRRHAHAGRCLQADMAGLHPAQGA